jgi:type I restriction enzyme R subunit
MAKAIGAALLGPRPADDGDGESEINVVDIGQLVGKFTTELMTLDALFAGVDKTDTNLASLAGAHERIPDGSSAREQFIQGFVALQAIWEFLDPNPMLAGAKGTYVWLAKVYQSVLPRDHSKTFLWEKYGAKTQALIHASMSNIKVQPQPGRNVTLDAGGLALVKRIAEQLRLASLPTQSGKNTGEVYQGVLDSIEARLKRRIEDVDAAVYKSLADRIEKLRTQAKTNVEESLSILEEALHIARDVVAADRAAEAGDLDLYDSKTGALTQIVEENTPPGLHKIIPKIVQEIDSIVVEVAFVGWHEDADGDKKVRRELRSTLKNHGLAVTGALFDKTYAYVRENY